jgi:hypothetical protein
MPTLFPATCIVVIPSSKIRQPAIGARPTTIQSEGNQLFVRDQHVVEAKGISRQGERSQQSQRHPPAITARVPSNFRDPHSVLRDHLPLVAATPAIIYCAGHQPSKLGRSAVIARGATTQCEGRQW